MYKLIKHFTIGGIILHEQSTSSFYSIELKTVTKPDKCLVLLCFLCHVYNYGFVAYVFDPYGDYPV